MNYEVNQEVWIMLNNKPVKRFLFGVTLLSNFGKNLEEDVSFHLTQERVTDRNMHPKHLPGALVLPAKECYPNKAALQDAVFKQEEAR